MTRRYLSMLLLLVLLASGVARAQSFEFIGAHQPQISLDGLWKFHTGDNPEWKKPDFDDAQWPLLRSDTAWTKQGYPNGGFGWYRFRVEMPDGRQPVSLFLPPILTGYEVYAEGVLIGKAGSTEPTRNPAFSGPEVFPIPTGRAGPHTLQIALRVWNYQSFATWLGGGPREAGSAIGYDAPLREHLRLDLDARALNYVNDYGYALIATLVGLTTLGLFWSCSDDEYLCISILLLAQAAAAGLFVLSNLNLIAFSLWRFLFDIAGAVSVIAAMLFFSIVLHLRRSVLWWTGCIAAAASPLTVGLFYFEIVGVPVSYVIQICCLLPAYLWIIVQLARCALQADVSARILFVPAALFYGFGIYDLILRVRWQLGGPGYQGFVENPFVRSPFPLYPGDVINFIFVLSLLVFLVRRFAQTRKEETRLSTEMEAARSIQSILVSTRSEGTPGFLLESVYLPANEVGGDFFLALPGEDRSLLIVVGDVSGKGLKAAMTVSTIVGALRNEKERQPNTVLRNLNRVLYGQISGFVTCSAALVSSDGGMAIANAGHLSPYRNGHEMALANGLPLGIAAEIEYEECYEKLCPGDRLTFLSDGVIEATNDKRELFGFERAQQMSGRPVAEIAAAAQQFGQEDDISVISIVLTGEAATAPC